ncbi:alpha-glucosidase [Bifidobacterium sp. ESL0790]|uniref:glycoside hydrolase family 13 protein n=1 Tax=Bifidobacterium sp. ESL0790 TaxID=2983233 RepID=UPI0023F6A0E4|nr:alpha-glucosidase [Bifidobacterium sp. ESL0790]WEV71942.1 alpha-glucosidase [Bifidobacterium sp. ESL0790]
MVEQQRKAIPDEIRTNGATPNPWWANAVVYQVYPRSFQDSNDDGFGDIPGIISRLDYIAGLGVDVLWLSPVYVSPQVDNGYDIADYQNIDPRFGTMDDMDELLRQAHQRGLKVVMDLVVNHTSDEHAWFQASRDKNDEHADWYWWRPARKGHEPGAPGAEPNKWGSYFGGSAWTYDLKRGEYYLHQYSSKQPDLNWENPAVRKAIYAMMNWWMDRGVDGFRMDVIVEISKRVDSHGHLPGEQGGHIPDLPASHGYSTPFLACTDGPRLDEFLREMRHEVFDGRDGYLTVGEAPGLRVKRDGVITDPANGELDMMFLFTHVLFDGKNYDTWNPIPFRMSALRKILAKEQKVVREAGWASLYFENHDQPRVISRWGDDSEAMRVRCAKAFALLLHMHRGTPYIFQGEELGMTNAHFTRLDQYRDIQSLNAYRDHVEGDYGMSPDEMLDLLAKRSRDNARTPMQWDDSRYAGFMSPDADAEPWLAVNPNHDAINAKAEMADLDSVYSFYKRLIELRHKNMVVAAGDWELIDRHDENVYAFVRSLGDERLLVVVNCSSEEAAIPRQSAKLISESGELDDGRLVISTTGAFPSEGRLGPWEGFVYKV